MRKALIVDDSRTTRALIRKIVKDLGFDTLEAGNGQEALDVLKSEVGVSLVLVDWNMPVMTGIEFVELARQNPDYNPIQMVMVTTETELVQVSRALNAGANEYVMKPFTKEILLEKLSILGL